MSTIAVSSNAIQEPDREKLAQTRSLLIETQRFFAVIWQSRPLLQTLDPSIGRIVCQHVLHCYAQANAYEIGAIGLAELDCELRTLGQLLDQMQQTIDDALRIRFEYADALLDILGHTKPAFAVLLSPNTGQPRDSLIMLEQTIHRINRAQLAVVAESGELGGESAC